MSATKKPPPEPVVVVEPEKEVVVIIKQDGTVVDEGVIIPQVPKGKQVMIWSKAYTYRDIIRDFNDCVASIL